MVPPETHTRPKQIRIPDDLWEELGQVVGSRGRAAVVVALIRCYLRKPGAKMPKMPRPAHDATAAPGDAQDHTRP